MNSYDFMVDRLKRPNGMVDVVLDTDAYNEIDDQYAIAYMLKAPHKFNVRAITAAPFHNKKSDGPEDGMEKSYDEIIKLLQFAKMEGHIERVYKGSRGYLEGEDKPRVSPAAEQIVEIAMGMPQDKPLYVVAIGAITNVASAIILEPRIAKKIVVVWLGGHSLEWHRTDEFNMVQDIAAARVVLGCGVPVVMLPCRGVVDHLTTTEFELNHWLRGKNELSTYLAQNTIEEANTYAKGKAWSRVIWDVSAVAWFLDDKFMLGRLEPAPIPSYDAYYQVDRTKHPIMYIYNVERDLIFQDLFERLVY